MKIVSWKMKKIKLRVSLKRIMKKSMKEKEKLSNMRKVIPESKDKLQN